jgi:DNA-binding CsgD family transcriptional regulator
MLISADANGMASMGPSAGAMGLRNYLGTTPGTERAGPGGRLDMLDEIEDFLAVALPEMEAGRCLATVLVIGIGDAAALALRLGHEQWRTYRMSFEQAVRRQVQRFGGETWGDSLGGVTATFESPVRAIRCAATIASAMRRIAVTVRAGIHVGELECAETGPSGVVLEVAQSLYEQGGESEILVSSIVRELVVGAGLLFEPATVRTRALVEQGWDVLRVVDRSQGPAAPRMPEAERLPQSGMVLSRREREVAVLVADGRSNQQIADALFIARSTVERHVANMLNKLGFHSRTQIAAWAVSSGLTAA